MRLIANSEHSAARVEAGTRNIVTLHTASEHFIRAIPKPTTRDAVVVVDWLAYRPEGSFTVANDDLLQTSLARAYSDEPPVFGFQTLSALYDGRMYGPKGEGTNDWLQGEGKYDSMHGNSPYSFSARNGKSATFVLDTSVNKLGYTINSIDVYTGHLCDRIGQKYKVEFSRVGQEGWLSSPVATFERRALWDNGVWEACSHIRSGAPDAPLATGIERIRFTFYALHHPQHEATLLESVYREIDVFGSPTGPASAPSEPRLQPEEKASQP